MNLGLQGRVAIVAAASSGLGKAVAFALAVEGASVAINGRTESRLLEAAADICATTRSEVLPITGDLTNEESVQRLISETILRFGRIDILVANAGGPPAGFFDDFDADAYRKAVELNLISTVNLCREAVPHMREQAWGRIVAITSIAAKQPIDNLILSNTARAGVLGFMKSLSQQVAESGITVNTVCPGYHLTERLASLASLTAQNEGVTVEEVYARWAASTPMKRIGEPKEFAALVTFLCSEQASYITGTVIQVDGGAYRGLI
jgi:3-oxoacyl-[acyl-carrier protein] reductase